jgi:hypothetical protein
VIFKCAIDNHRGVKNGLKITLHIEEEEQLKVLQNLSNFMKKPLLVDIRIDEKEQRQRLSQISPEQRKKIYALFRDIADYTGDNVEAVKINTKHLFLKSYGQHEDFSLSDCSTELAKDYINFLVAWCFMNGVDLQDKPREILEDIETYLWLCLKYRKCAVCGQTADIHHVQAIGQGRDRRIYDDSRHQKIALCREHHAEAHTIGWQTFAGKYHVKGLIYNE